MKTWRVILGLLLVCFPLGVVYIAVSSISDEQPIINNIQCQSLTSSFNFKRERDSPGLTYHIENDTLFVDNGVGQRAFWKFHAPAYCFTNVPHVNIKAIPQKKKGFGA